MLNYFAPIFFPQILYLVPTDGSTAGVPDSLAKHEHMQSENQALYQKAALYYLCQFFCQEIFVVHRYVFFQMHLFINQRTFIFYLIVKTSQFVLWICDLKIGNMDTTLKMFTVFKEN